MKTKMTYKEFNETMKPDKWLAIIIMFSFFTGMLAYDLKANMTYQICDAFFTGCIIYIIVWLTNVTIENIISYVKTKKAKKQQNNTEVKE